MLPYMPLIIPAGYCQVTLNYAGPMFDSGGAASTFGLGNDILTTASLETALQKVADAFEDNLAPQLDSDVTMTSVYGLTSLLSMDLPANIPGTASGLAPPPNTALLVKKITNQRGPRGKGRIAFPAMLRQGDVNEDGTLSTPAFTTATNAMNGFFDAITSGTDPFFFYLLQGDNPGDKTPFINPPPSIAALAAQPKVSTIRRRLRR